MDKKPKQPSEAEEGVFYADADLLTPLGRYAIILIDSLVLLGLGLLCVLLPVVAESAIVTWLAMCLLYLVVIKRSRFRTLGYRIMGARIVDLHGNQPSYLRMLVRLCIVQMAIGSPLLDFIWSHLRNQRTMRDLVAGTYVIRTNAQISGRGQIRSMYLFVWSNTLYIREVCPDTNAGVDKAEKQRVGT